MPCRSPSPGAGWRDGGDRLHEWLLARSLPRAGRSRRPAADGRAGRARSSACWSNPGARARASARSASCRSRRGSRRCRSRWSASATACCSRCRSATPPASAPATVIVSRGAPASVPVGDATARPRHRRARPSARRPRPARRRTPSARFTRRRSIRSRASPIAQPIGTGVRAIDALLTVRPRPARRPVRRQRRRARARCSA